MFGYFCRRAVVSYMKLSFAGVSKLRLDYHEWLNGSTTAGYEPFRRDLITFGTASRTYSESAISLYSYLVSDPNPASNVGSRLVTRMRPPRACEGSSNSIFMRAVIRQ